MKNATLHIEMSEYMENEINQPLPPTLPFKR